MSPTVQVVMLCVVLIGCTAWVVSAIHRATDAIGGAEDTPPPPALTDSTPRLGG